MEDASGQRKGDIYIRHSRTPDVIRWEYATPEEAGLPSQPAAQTPRQSSVKGSLRAF